MCSALSADKSISPQSPTHAFILSHAFTHAFTHACILLLLRSRCLACRLCAPIPSLSHHGQLGSEAMQEGRITAWILWGDAHGVGRECHGPSLSKQHEEVGQGGAQPELASVSYSQKLVVFIDRHQPGLGWSPLSPSSSASRSSRVLILCFVSTLSNVRFSTSLSEVIWPDLNNHVMSNP